MTDGDWFYISFIDNRRPRGDQFIGGCYVRAVNDPTAAASARRLALERRGDGTTLDDDELPAALALARATGLGINPGGEAMVLGPIPGNLIDENIPPADRERLLARNEIT